MTFLFDIVWGFALGVVYEELDEDVSTLVIFVGPLQFIFINEPDS